MIILYKCFECGFKGEVLSGNRYVVCPECSTINDWWLDIEMPPVNHIKHYNSFKTNYSKDSELCISTKMKSIIKNKKK